MKAMLLALAACGSPPASPDAGSPVAPTGHSSSIVATADAVYVVNPDADSISILDPTARALVAEVLLGGARPAPDATGAFAPAVMPRALALDGGTLSVTGERAGALFAVDLATRAVRSVPVCSEPIGVAVAADAIVVACSQDAEVVAVSKELAIVATIAVPAEPWALAWAADGALLVTQLLGSGVTAIDPVARTVRATWAIPDTAPRGDKRLAHGQVRGLYDVAARPGSTEVWVAHLLLGTDTAQPDLDFESTVFPSLSVLRADGTYRVTLSNDVLELPGTDGSFGDVVSGPHAIAFTSDGAYALVVDSNSEDVLAVGAEREGVGALLRPRRGLMPEGIARAPVEAVAVFGGRTTGEVAIVRIDRTSGVALATDGSIGRLASDPMPAALRLGQHLF